MSRPKSTRVTCICKRCGQTFSVWRSAYLRGEGTYCSPRCSYGVQECIVVSRNPSIVLVPLTKGKSAVIDSVDAERVKQFNWYAVKDHGRSWRARSTIPGDSRHSIFLHQFILEAELGSEIDHKNGNPLDNRRANLRFVSQTQNRWNQGKRRDNASGFIGVSFHRGKWRAFIHMNGNHHHLGYFDSPEAAAHARDKAVREGHGEFARTNFRDK